MHFGRGPEAANIDDVALTVKHWPRGSARTLDVHPIGPHWDTGLVNKNDASVQRVGSQVLPDQSPQRLSPSLPPQDDQHESRWAPSNHSLQSQDNSLERPHQTPQYSAEAAMKSCRAANPRIRPEVCQARVRGEASPSSKSVRGYRNKTTCPACVMRTPPSGQQWCTSECLHLPSRAWHEDRDKLDQSILSCWTASRSAFARRYSTRFSTSAWKGAGSLSTCSWILSLRAIRQPSYSMHDELRTILFYPEFAGT